MKDSNYNDVLHAKSKRNLFNNADVSVRVVASTLDFIAIIGTLVCETNSNGIKTD